MATPLGTKSLWILIASLVSAILVYVRHVPRVGYTEEQSYFENKEKGSASTPFDLPVYILTGQNVNVAPTKTAPTTSRLTTDNRCQSDLTLCEKIKFIGNFSEADKRKYQSLIIRQINNIDQLLDETILLKDALYSITLDSTKGSRRGRAGRETVTIYLGNIKNQDEFLEILTHELGHIVDLGILDGNKHITQNSFFNIDHTFFPANDDSLEFYNISWITNTTRKENASAMGFVGGYAMSDPFEDFAESMNMYLNHHHVFVLLANNNSEIKEKYNFMQNLFHKRYIKADSATASTMKNRIETRPRDTTKGY